FVADGILYLEQVANFVITSAGDACGIGARQRIVGLVVGIDNGAGRSTAGLQNIVITIVLGIRSPRGRADHGRNAVGKVIGGGDGAVGVDGLGGPATTIIADGCR